TPESPVTLVGISLGGNIVLKLAGEAAERPGAGLARVAGLAPPSDMGRRAALPAQRRNRLYGDFFPRDLSTYAPNGPPSFPDPPPFDLPKQVTIRQFDDLYAAARSGFEGADDYYRRASSLPLIGRIQLPTFILTARDDTFIAVEPFEEVKAPSHVEV